MDSASGGWCDVQFQCHSPSIGWSLAAAGTTLSSFNSFQTHHVFSCIYGKSAKLLA